MCDPKVTGIMPGFLIGRGQRKQAAQPCQCHQPQPRDTPTQFAQRVLAVVGGIVLLASVNLILHALLIALASIFVITAGTAAVVAVRRHRRRMAVIPAPPPAGPVRTVVTAVTVQVIGQAARSALTARERAESQVRR